MAVNKSRIRLYGALLVFNLIVFALSAHVNSFTGFFYVADLFPFAMSIITAVLVGATLLSDLRRSNANPVLSRPMFELPWLVLLALFWLCANAFSSSRWKNVQAADCGSIPTDGDLNSVTVWCKEIQALRSFVWVEWIIVIGTLCWLWLQTSRESARGNRHAWSTSFARPQKASLAHLSFDNAARRGAMSPGAASSFHTGEDGSRYSTQSQQFPTDFEKESAEHYNNTHNAHVPGHQHNTSGLSGYAQNQQNQQYSVDPQYPGQQSYDYNPSYGYSSHYAQPQQSSYGYGYQQQVQSSQQQQQEEQQPGYFFGGYGQAR